MLRNIVCALVLLFSVSSIAGTAKLQDANGNSNETGPVISKQEMKPDFSAARRRSLLIIEPPQYPYGYCQHPYCHQPQQECREMKPQQYQDRPQYQNGPYCNYPSEKPPTHCPYAHDGRRPYDDTPQERYKETKPQQYQDRPQAQDRLRSQSPGRQSREQYPDAYWSRPEIEEQPYCFDEMSPIRDGEDSQWDDDPYSFIPREDFHEECPDDDWQLAEDEEQPFWSN
ncbi:hypothetical protein Aperf_G00000083891 [Anoplocephala perfoliata]